MSNVDIYTCHGTFTYTQEVTTSQANYAFACELALQVWGEFIGKKVERLPAGSVVNVTHAEFGRDKSAQVEVTVRY